MFVEGGRARIRLDPETRQARLSGDPDRVIEEEAAEEEVDAVAEPPMDPPVEPPVDPGA